jgi:hypothetical protein
MKEEDGGNDMALLVSSINQCILQAGFACWVDANERPVILNVRYVLVSRIRDGKSWIHLTLGNETGHKLGMRTETIQHRKNLINWASKTDEIFSARRDCLGLIGPGAVRFIKTEGDFSEFLLPEPKTPTVFRHRRAVPAGTRL